MHIVGIETSCDDTAIAIVEDANRVKANSISSQVKIHAEYGGVVPELASRHHLTNILPVFNTCIEKAQIELKDISAVAVTKGPGLVVSLLVGLNFAKGLAYSLKIPLISVNHLISHINSVFIEHDEIPFPFLALVASGGHTNLFYSDDNFRFTCIARTRDDAVGEAYDKVAKLLGLGYPGGPIIDALAREGKPGLIKFPLARMSDNSMDFSFSGLKTAFYYYTKKENILPARIQEKELLGSLLADFQEAAISIIEDRMTRAIKSYKPRSLIISGGVACNSLLRMKAHELGKRFGIKVFIPSPVYCTDNAVMTAIVGYNKFQKNLFAPFSIDADAIYYDY